MGVDVKLFAPVARATNAIYMYVKLDETLATIEGANYFDNKDLAGSVKVGDIVMVNAEDGFAILTVKTVVPAEGTITVESKLTSAE